MHIKKIILDSFKSFGRQTQIPFHDDFTTVSGPNGSGKSNLIDAILFALGLARSTGIRAEKLTDLIYDPGQENDQEPSGPREASVEVILDNSDKTLSREQLETIGGIKTESDIEELRIKRRVKQTESNYYSYYYLNGRSVNLSDIRDVLSQAGVTPEGYNVVMQGDITEIISMSPYRRREIIDEIAGVSEFDAKIADAHEELTVVKERVDEATLRLNEKQERLDQLKDERETALQYQEIREEKEEYEAYLKAAELEEKRDELEAITTRITDRKERLDQLQDEREERNAVVTKIETELDDLNREIERKGEDEQLTLRREIEEIKGEIARIEGEIESAESRIDEAESNRRDAFIALDRKEETLDDLTTKIKEQKVEKATITAEIQDREKDLESVRSEIDNIGAEYEGLKDELDEKRSLLQEIKDEKNELQREQDRLLDEARRRSNELNDVKNELKELDNRIKELNTSIDDLQEELNSAKELESQKKTQVTELRDEKTALTEKLREVEDELRAKQQEYAELTAENDSPGDASYGRAVSAVLNAEINGVHGTVAQLGHVDERFATACETAAGSRLANVVVADDSVGQECIEHLKSRHAGRATFLPITKMRQYSRPSLPDRDGVIDFAYNLVEFNSQYDSVFSYVLGDTIVVDTMQTARSLMGDYRLVTLAGDLIEKSGAMTGGSTSGSRYSFSGELGQQGRIADQITELENKQRSIREELSSVDTQLNEAQDEKSAATDDVRSIQGKIERAERDRSEAKERKKTLNNRISEIETERDQVNQQMQEIEESIKTQNEKQESIESAISEIEDELSDSRLPELTQEAESIEQDINNLNARISEIDSTLNEHKLEKQYTEEAIEGLHRDIEVAQNRKTEQENRITNLEDRIEELNDKLEAKQDAVDELEEQLAELKSDREDLRDELREAKQQRTKTEEKISKVETKITNLQHTTEQLEDAISDLEAIVDEYDPEETPDLDEVQSTINRLEGKMQQLEPVNMLAIEEYEAVESELDDLSDRKATLVDERNGIKDRIDSFEQQKRDSFMEAFESVDTHFQDIFERLSDGTGELLLENPEDPFDGGLTMRAKPEDKPIRRLNAMSGGEKSLTALAFIFALQRYNPAPFYALDEIDAFLDAANAERVGGMLDELAANAQFIVVSHRSALLERSERAIGVTMQEDNISSVTGIMMADGGFPDTV